MALFALLAFAFLPARPALAGDNKSWDDIAGQRYATRDNRIQFRPSGGFDLIEGKDDFKIAHGDGRRLTVTKLSDWEPHSYDIVQVSSDAAAELPVKLAPIGAACTPTEPLKIKMPNGWRGAGTEYLCMMPTADRYSYSYLVFRAGGGPIYSAYGERMSPDQIADVVGTGVFVPPPPGLAYSDDLKLQVPIPEGFKRGHTDGMVLTLVGSASRSFYIARVGDWTPGGAVGALQGEKQRQAGQGVACGDPAPHQSTLKNGWSVDGGELGCGTKFTSMLAYVVGTSTYVAQAQGFSAEQTAALLSNSAPIGPPKKKIPVWAFILPVVLIGAVVYIKKKKAAAPA